MIRTISLCIIVCIGLLSLPSFVHADVTIEIDAGYLFTKTGAPMPMQGLLQLIASPIVPVTSPDGTFTSPTSASFVTGNNILVASFAMNYVNGGNVNPETDSFVTFTLGAGTTPVIQGDALLLRWYPTLTTASTSPGTGASYGQYRSDSGEANEGGMAWFVPADGTYLFPNGLNFNTASAGNSANPDLLGYASLTVLPVPEPSIYTFIGVVALGYGGLWLRRRRAQLG